MSVCLFWQNFIKLINRSIYDDSGFLGFLYDGVSLEVSRYFLTVPCSVAVSLSAFEMKARRRPMFLFMNWSLLNTKIQIHPPIETSETIMLTHCRILNQSDGPALAVDLYLLE